MNDTHAKSHVGAYITIYLALLALVAVTVGVAHIQTGVLAFPICMSVAILKTVLIVAVFMHVKDELPLVRIFSYIGVLWLILFFSFLMSDYLTRPQMRATPFNTNIQTPTDAHTSEPETIHSADH